MGQSTRQPGHQDAPTGDAIRVRCATRGDAHAAARVWRMAWHDAHCGHVPAGLLAARGPDYFDAQTVAWTSLTALAVDTTDRILGLVVVADDELVQLAVDQSARRIGIGALLLDVAEHRIGVSHDHAWLAVVPGNIRARRFYQHHGWRDAGPMIYQAPASPLPMPVDVRRYVKNLTVPSATISTPQRGQSGDVDPDDHERCAGTRPTFRTDSNHHPDGSSEPPSTRPPKTRRLT